MNYENLNALVHGSNSSRQYFLSLPVSVQIELCEYGNCIHTAADLHRRVAELEIYRRQVQISEFFQ